MSGGNSKHDKEKNIKDIQHLFEQYYKMLYNVANNIINDRDAAKDIVQDVFLKLWQKREKLNFNSSMPGYLYKATINTSLNYLKSRKRTAFFSDELFKHFAKASNTVDDELSYKELKGKVKKALNRLPSKCKVIFVLSRYQGMKYRQIAEYLNISVKTVENQMSIALKKLRKDLRHYLVSELIFMLALSNLSLHL